MGSDVVVEEGELCKTMSEIGLRSDGELIEFLFEGEKEAFDATVLPRAAWRGSLVFDAEQT